MKSRKLRILVLVLAVPAALLLLLAYWPPPPGPMGEVAGADEDVYTSQIVASGIEMIAATRREVGDGVYRRDAHAKTHGCAAATFTVKPLDGIYRHGLFAEPASYKAWVRYSSGSTSLQSDWMPDARGMAVKVLGVKGAKLLAGERDARTQDFLMIDNPVFFIRNIGEYASLTKYQGEGNQFGYFFERSKWNPFQWRLRELRIGLGILKFPPKNLLSTQYYSMTAYQFGPRGYVKYSAKPVPCGPDGGVQGSFPPFDGNGLSKALVDRLMRGSACFDLMVQLQDPAKNMPIEDTTVEWSQSDSPFVPVARIEIPRQDIRMATDSGFAENLSMTPWHSLPEHRPVGGLNRVRMAVYQGIARYRRCKNGVDFGEPKDDGSMDFDSKPCSAYGPVPLLEGTTAGARSPGSAQPGGRSRNARDLRLPPVASRPDSGKSEP